MRKYQNLADYLGNLSVTQAKLSFSEIEHLIGENLPPSAKTHQAWWANSRTKDSHTWAHLWLKAGWERTKLSLSGKWVMFQQVNLPKDNPSAKAHLRITWQDKQSNGYTDVFDAETFSSVSSRMVITHEVLGPKGGTASAKCLLTVHSKAAELDYEGFKTFNTRRGMFLGITRILFSDTDRSKVCNLEWKPIGSNIFEEMPFKVAAYELPRIPDYKGAKKPARLVSRKVRERPGQAEFRRKLKQTYGHTCCISGCSVSEALEGAHIDPYEGPDSDNPQNGLLLRRDLHKLFDEYLVGIEPKTRRVIFAEEARTWVEYARLHGRNLRLPTNGGMSYYPSTPALERRWKRFEERLGK